MQVQILSPDLTLTLTMRRAGEQEGNLIHLASSQDIKCQPEPFLPPFEVARQVGDLFHAPVLMLRINVMPLSSLRARPLFGGCCGGQVETAGTRRRSVARSKAISCCTCHSSAPGTVLTCAKRYARSSTDAFQ